MLYKKTKGNDGYLVTAMRGLHDVYEYISNSSTQFLHEGCQSTLHCLL